MEELNLFRVAVADLWVVEPDCIRTRRRRHSYDVRPDDYVRLVEFLKRQTASIMVAVAISVLLSTSTRPDLGAESAVRRPRRVPRA